MTKEEEIKDVIKRYIIIAMMCKHDDDIDLLTDLLVVSEIEELHNLDVVFNVTHTEKPICRIHDTDYYYVEEGVPLTQVL